MTINLLRIIALNFDYTENNGDVGAKREVKERLEVPFVHAAHNS